MDRLNTILDKKSKIINDIMRQKNGSTSYKKRAEELVELTEETKIAMSDSEYILHDFEIKNRKKLVEICNIILEDLKDLLSVL